MTLDDRQTTGRQWSVLLRGAGISAVVFVLSTLFFGLVGDGLGRSGVLVLFVVALVVGAIAVRTAQARTQRSLLRAGALSIAIFLASSLLVGLLAGSLVRSEALVLFVVALVAGAIAGRSTRTAR